MFDDTDRDPNAADPPDQTGGGGQAESTEDDSSMADPPDQTGGGGKSAD